MITFSKTLLITWEPVCPLAARNCAVVSNQKCMFRPALLPPLMHIAQVRYTAADWHKPPVAKKGSKGSQSHIDPIRSGVGFQIWCRISNLVQDFKSGAGFKIRCGIGKSKVHVESRSTAFSHAHLQLPAPTNCGQKRNPRRNSSSQSHVRFNQIWDWLEFSHLSVVSVDSVDFPNLISFLR